MKALSLFLAGATVALAFPATAAADVSVSAGVSAHRGHRGHVHGGWHRHHRHYWWGPSISVGIPLTYGYWNDPYLHAYPTRYVVRGERDGVAWHTQPAEPSVPAATDALSITALRGQSDTQKSFDRIDCEKAAMGQTGFDPNAADGEALKRAEFVKATAACLQGKGYTVK